MYVNTIYAVNTILSKVLKAMKGAVIYMMNINNN